MNEPNGTAKGEYMHESVEKDAVKYDLPPEEIIQALAEDNKQLQAELDKAKTEAEARKVLLSCVLIMFGKFVESKNESQLLKSMQDIEQALKGKE